MRTRLVAALVGAAFGLSLSTSAAANTADRPATSGAAEAGMSTSDRTAPKLVVAIAVDQFSADLFAQYRQHYTGGFARLMQGAVFPSAYQSHSATETCPGHSTLLTGVHPARSGIIANNWYDTKLKRPDKRVYCAEDERNPNSSSKYPIVSARHLRVPTLGEWMKRQWPDSRNVAVSAKDRAVVMMGGHQIDAAYWRQGAGFASFDGVDLGPEAMAENARVVPMVANGMGPIAAPAWCAPRDRSISIDYLKVGRGRFAIRPDMVDDYRKSPRLDAATLDLAEKLVASMKLGQTAAPDMLSISLSATDYIGHAYGTEGMEMCIQMAELDKALGSFFDWLDAQGIDYVVMLTADHGGEDVPERLDQQGLPSAKRASGALLGFALGSQIARKLGLSQFVRDFDPAKGPPMIPFGQPQLVYSSSPYGDYYVNTHLPPKVRARVIAMLANMLRASPEVDKVYTRDEIARMPMPAGNPQDWTIAERVRASFDAERSGDVFSVLHRNVVPVPYPSFNYATTHGSPRDYDRRVPLLFWRAGLPGMEQPHPVDTVDIAPTLAALIDLRVPQGTWDGRCLDIDGSAGDTCATPH